MSEPYRKVDEIISNIFENISTEKMNDNINMINSWKSVLMSINSRTNKNIGNLLVSHTKVIDLKNKVLLIETDHPGYIQTLQMYNSYILRGLKQKVPELEIKYLSFRLKGTNFKLPDVEMPKNKFETIEKEELIKNFDVNKDLPKDLMENFNKLKKEIDKIKKDILTKDE
ncbi:MAG: DciA family protein [Treponemataceae bacterium]|nr:DciA family protein [Treponemataceae bacterium]